MINPWIYYLINEPDKIPSVVPSDKEEARGCLAALAGAIVSTLVFILSAILVCKFKLETAAVLLSLCAILYAALTIALITLFMRISDKIRRKKRQVTNHKK